jgi:hypothetical protein
MIILQKTKNQRIVAIKEWNGLYTIENQGRRIFGRGWDSIVLKDRLTRAQVLQAKKQIAQAI